MPDVHSCRELANAWNIKSEPHAGSQAYPAFRDKLKALVKRNPFKAMQLIVLLWEECEQEWFESTLQHREAMLTGRADRK